MTILPIEVRDKPPAHFHIPFTFRVDAVVQPREEACKGSLCECGFFLSNLSCEHGVPTMQDT